jgi:hypothetical protein
MRQLPAVLLVFGLSFATAQEQSADKFSGSMFGDYFYNISRDSNLPSLSNVALPGKTADQAFQFRRIYLTYDNEISATFSSRFRLEADQTALTSDGKISVAVKDAYLRWKHIFAGSDLLFGIQPTPAFDVSESVWRFRSLEKTILDLRSVVGSRDLGVALKGALVENGILQYWLMIADGSGNKPETDKYKRYYIHLHLKPVQNIQLTLYADYHARPTIPDPFKPESKLNNDNITYAIFLGYTNVDGLSIGAEGFLQSTAHGYRRGTSLTTNRAAGISLFGTASALDNLELVARYDYYDANIDRAARGDARHFSIGGVAWKVDKNVSIIPNVLYEFYEKNTDGRTFRASLTGRITLFYQFL